ncbi:CAP domain-containing protein [Lacticaseibacillus casei]|uniref:CAP domain-containing protein n=1 Tax=Lacticaseibacillus casei TaxID=1582 RepID=A0ABZ0C077_LACCA|nr:CAP domain-containing protein [Lacticaseibacillus casei]WNX27030.1 CAP domain-containing protein [Lacticaseibacillus casei]
MTNHVNADTQSDIETAIKVTDQVQKTATQADNLQNSEVTRDKNAGFQVTREQNNQPTVDNQEKTTVSPQQETQQVSTTKEASQASAPVSQQKNETVATTTEEPVVHLASTTSENDPSRSAQNVSQPAATAELTKNDKYTEEGSSLSAELQSIAESETKTSSSFTEGSTSITSNATSDEVEKNQEARVRQAINASLHIDQYVSSINQGQDEAKLEEVTSSSVADHASAIILGATSTSAAQPWLTAPDLSQLVKQISDVYNLTLGDAVKWAIKNGVNGALDGLSAIVSGLRSVAGSLPIVNVILPLASGAIKAAQDAVTVANSLGIDPTGLVSGALNLGINTIGKAIQGVISPVLKAIPFIGQNLANSINPLLDTATNLGPASIVKAVAGVVGLSGVLTGVSNITATVAPTIINALQGVLNISVSVVNGIASFAGSAMTMFKDVLGGIMAPIQWVINQVKTTIQGLFPGSSSTGAATNNNNGKDHQNGDSKTPAPKTPDATDSDSTDTSKSTTLTPYINLFDMSIPLGTRWNPTKMLIAAVNSTGKAVSLSDIRIDGTVLVTLPGIYFQRFEFTDPDGTIVTKMGKVRVGGKESYTIPSDSATLASIKNAIQSLPHSDSNPASRFTSTTNYPSKEAVYLAVNPDFKPDAKEIAGEFLQYVNQLRTSNGQKPLSYSASEEAFATKRVQEIMTNFSHDGSHGSTEDIGASKGIIEGMHSNQEIAYYLVMDWYDESDNPEPIGDGHYGHRANLLYGGPTMGLAFTQSPSEKNQYSYYYAFEAPTYSDKSLYDKALAMANAKTNPQTVPLPDITFVYVDSPKFASLQAQLKQLQAEQKAIAPNADPAIKTVAVA